MLTLLQLQQKLQNGLLNNDDSILAYIKPTPRLSPSAQLEIYQHSIVARFQKVLCETYPVCEKLVGKAFFLSLARAYINQHPATHIDLNNYGNTLADFSYSYPATQSIPYLSDMAALEWAWHQLDDTPALRAFDFAKLAQFEQQQAWQICFALPPCSTLLKSSYPLHKIWLMNQEDTLATEKLVLEDHLTYYYLLCKRQDEKRMELVSAFEWQLLTWFQAGLNLEQVHQLVNESSLPTDLPQILPKLVAQQWLYDCYLETEPSL